MKRNYDRLQKFTFKMEKPPKWEALFDVVAKTAAEAVRIKNEALDEIQEEQKSLYIVWSGGGEEPLYVPVVPFLTPDMRVDEDMIVNQEDVSDTELRKAHEYLTARGYESDGSFDELLSTDEPAFHKSICTEDGNAVDASFRVTGRYCYNYGARIGFQIEAILYPKAESQLGNDGTLGYGVRLWDRQEWTKIDDLPNALELYEEKFMELIKVLRKADPFDGAPPSNFELIG